MSCQSVINSFIHSLLTHIFRHDPIPPKITKYPSNHNTQKMRPLLHIPPLFALCVASPLATTHKPARDADLGARQIGGSGTTRNDLVSGGCGRAVVVFARGTTEPGNVGQVAGPPFFDVLAERVPDLAVQGVDYAAGIGGIVEGGDKSGTAKM